MITSLFICQVYQQQHYLKNCINEICINYKQYNKQKACNIQVVCNYNIETEAMYKHTLPGKILKLHSLTFAKKFILLSWCNPLSQIVEFDDGGYC